LESKWSQSNEKEITMREALHIQNKCVILPEDFIKALWDIFVTMYDTKHSSSKS
jgi:hypothetical protein